MRFFGGFALVLGFGKLVGCSNISSSGGTSKPKPQRPGRLQLISTCILTQLHGVGWRGQRDPAAIQDVFR